MAVSFEKNTTPNFLSEKLNPRKSPQDYQKDSFEKMNEQIDKDIQFAMTMLIENAKNQLPSFDGDSNGNNTANDMLQTTNLIAQLNSMKTQGKQTQKMVDAITNPGYSATEIQGAEIEYDDGKRVFDGRNPVEFGYKVDFDDNFKNGVVKTTIKIKNESGEVVATAQESAKKGDNTFTWDGISTALNKNNKNNKFAPMGSYTIEVKATGSHQGKSFHVTASTTKTDIVKSVELENGIATKINLQSGRNIDKSQVKRINEKQPEILPDVQADIDMIGRKVSLNFSKVTIENGSATINYYNKVKNHEDVKISIVDSKGRTVKKINYEGKLKFGEGELTLKDEIKNLKDGKYTVSINVKDLDENKVVQLDKYFSTRVVGIHKLNNTIHDTEGKVYPADLIEDIAGDYTSAFEKTKAAWIGKEIEYESDIMTFNGVELAFENNIQKPEAEGLPFQAKMWIYNDDNELVKIVNNDFNPMDMATDAGKVKLENIAHANYVTNFANVQAANEKADLYKLSFRELLLDPTQYIKDEFRTAESFTHNYKWDGQFDPAKVAGPITKAANGQNYRIKLENIYINANGDSFINANGEKDKITSKGVVSELSKDEFGKITVFLEDGTSVSEDKVIIAQTSAD